MQIEKYLEKYQPIVYKTFYSALKNKSLSHAYLISGEGGVPLLETAKFLAKSILCDDPSPWACNSCITCLRVESDNYPDLIVYDGAKSSIKKEAVYDIENRFEKTPLERKGIRIYILHLVENMTIEAINSLLKFLEEPEDNIYALLTTNNESLVLPTIISRCQLIHLKKVNQIDIVNDALQLGVERIDAELLSSFYSDADLLKQVLDNKETKNEYLNAKQALFSLLEAIKKDKREAIYIMQKDIEPLLKEKESARFFLDMLLYLFHDILNIKNEKNIILTSCATIISELSKQLNNVEESILQISKARTMLNLNVNTSLLLDNLIISICGEEKQENEY